MARKTKYRGPCSLRPGRFLVATPYLQNSPYRRSVVMLARYDQQGALGLVLSNELRSSVDSLEAFARQAIWSQLPKSAAGDEPVAKDEAAAELAAASEVTETPEESAADRLVPPDVAADNLRRGPRTPAGTPVEPPQLRMFSGVVMWQPGTLEREVAQGVWMVAPGKLGLALESQDLWLDMVREVGRSVWRAAPGVRRFPTNPNWN